MVARAGDGRRIAQAMTVRAKHSLPERSLYKIIPCELWRKGEAFAA